MGDQRLRTTRVVFRRPSALLQDTQTIATPYASHLAIVRTEQYRTRRIFCKSSQMCVPIVELRIK
jgi:hypothetical protein